MYTSYLLITSKVILLNNASKTLITFIITLNYLNTFDSFVLDCLLDLEGERNIVMIGI